MQWCLWLLIPCCAVACSSVTVVDDDAGSAGSTGSTGSTGSGPAACLPGEQQPCYSGPAETEQVGACHGGLRTCAADGSGFGACEGEALPQPAKCSGLGLDADCDGVGDDALCACLPGATVPCYTGPAGTEGVGACKAGTRVCDDEGKGYGPCLNQIVPAPDTCDTPDDDDCDGSTACSACAPGSGAWGVIYGNSENVPSGLEWPNDVATDESGVYFMFFFGTPNITVSSGGGPVTYTNAGTALWDSTDVVVVKYDFAGHPLWSRHFSGTDAEGMDTQFISAGALASDGQHLYVTMVTYSPSVAIDGVPVVENASEYIPVPALFKLDAASGDLVWGKAWPAEWTIPQAIDVDSKGRVVIAGKHLGGSLSFAGASAPCTDENWSVFAVKMDASGAAGAVDPIEEWVRCFGGPGDDFLEGPGGVALAADGSVYLTSTMTPSPPPMGDPFVGDARITKLDAGGAVAWMRELAGPGRQSAVAVAVSPSGAPHVVGAFAGTIDLDVPRTASPAGANCAPGELPTDAFVARLDPTTGQFDAAKIIGGGAHDVVNAIAFDASGRAVIAGWSGGSYADACKVSLTFDTSPPFSFTSAKTEPVLWLARLGDTLDAPATWASNFGNTSWTYPMAIAVDHLGYTHFAAAAELGVSLDFGAFTIDATSGLDDPLMASICRFGPGDAP